MTLVDAVSEDMGSLKLAFTLLLLSFICRCSAVGLDTTLTARLSVNASVGRVIPETLFGIFFEVSFSTNNLRHFLY